MLEGNFAKDNIIIYYERTKNKIKLMIVVCQWFYKISVLNFPFCYTIVLYIVFIISGVGVYRN